MRPQIGQGRRLCCGVEYPALVTLTTLSPPRRSHFEHATSSIGSRSAMSPSVTAPLLLIVLGKSFRATGLDRHHRPPPKDAHSGDDHMTDRLQP
jgi:hypothetical protein